MNEDSKKKTIDLNSIYKPKDEINISLVPPQLKNINTVTGEGLTDTENRNRNRIKVSPEEISNSINGNRKKDVVYKSGRSKIEEKALTDLDTAIERKTKEFKDAMEILDERDKANRSTLTDLSEVEGEIEYMARQDRDGNALTKEQAENLTEDDKFDEELEKELDNAVSNASVAINNEREKKIKIMNNTFNEDIEEDKYDDVVIDSDDDNEEDEYSGLDKLPTSEEFEKENNIVDEPVIDDEPTDDSLDEEELDNNDENTENNVADTNKIIIKSNSTDVGGVDPTSVERSNFSIDPEDFSDVDDIDDSKEIDKDEEERRKKIYNSFKSEILKKIVNKANKVNVTAFKVTKKTMSIQNALSRISKPKDEEIKSTATWALMSIGRPYVCTALSGPEIVMLSTSDDSVNSGFIANTQQLRILYKHDANPNKPDSFNAWCKSIPYIDLDNMFMAEYVATFSRGNYIPYSCTNKKCMHMYLKDEKDIMGKMVDFKNDKIKKKFYDIIETELTPELSGEYETAVIPITNTLAIGFKQPSLYNMLIELRSVARDFLDKYADVVTVISYIDTMYYIDSETQDIVPIDYKIYPNDVSKTFKSKIASYSRLISTLEASEFNSVIAYINQISDTENTISYRIPETKCEKCGSVIEEVATSGKNLVFTQQQLVGLATTSTEQVF